MTVLLTQNAAAGARLTAREPAANSGALLLSESFANEATAAGAWKATSPACLTAGSGAESSIPACESAAPLDPSGEGALQLTGGSHQHSIVVSTVPVSTANGLRIVYTDYSFDGSAPGGEGTVMFLTDASQPVPAAAGAGGSALGYAGQTLSGVSKPGLANAYIGVGLDEHGNYSNPAQGYRGGPGTVPETIAVRGAAASGWQYIGGYTNGAGTAASLPFTIDQQVAWRSSAAPTVRIDLTPGGTLSAAIDTHDGNGFVPYYAQSIVGIGGQPAVPATVHIGFSAGTEAAYGRHQIGNLTVTSLIAPDAAFAPTSVPNLSAWYDASNAGSLSLFGSSVAAWSDLSGNGNTLAQSSSRHEPSLVSSGINGKPSLAFGGSDYLMSSNGAFSSNLFNQSTVFAVTNQSSEVQHSSLLYSGVYDMDPHWGLILSEGGAARYDLGNKVTGRLSADDVAVGPALWTAAGSIGAQVQYLRKNGNLLASDKGPATATVGSYSLAVGAMAQGSSAGSFYNGQLGEVVVYNRYLSTAESEEVEGYLACKWGLQARLPANHPYRNACPQGGSPPSLPIPSPSPPGIGNPPQLRSANGLLTFNVTAQANPSTGSPTLLYNGSATLPTLRLLPGDTLVVNLTNSLKTPPANAGYTNYVNLHYHGLHVSPRAPGDDSIDMVAAPGASLHYQIAIPKSHPPGLYWYHPHVHGEVDRDVLAGMSGAIIIDGIVQYAPQVANMPERVLIARAAPLPGHVLPAANSNQLLAMRWAMQHGVGMHGGSSGIVGLTAHGAATTYLHGSTNDATRNPYVTVDPHYRSFKRADIVSNASGDGQCASSPQAPSYAFTLNGAAQPSIAIRPGEQQFWRLVNADADTYLNLSVDHTQMQIVAIDGVPLSNGVNTPASLKVANWLVPPGGRVEFIVTGPPVGASLRSLCFDSGPSGSPMPAMVLATLNSSASPTDLLKLRQVQRRASGAQRYQILAHSAASLRAHAVANTRTVYYSDQYTINGTAYDPSGPPMFYVQSGTTEEWTVVNTSTQVHTFHIHQIHFLVEAINGVTQSQQYLMDDVNVPAATSAGPGSVKLLLDFTDPTIVGTFLFHCHILSHEDGGMMAKVQVGGLPPLALSASQVNFKSPTAASQSVTVSGGTAPYSVSGCAGVAKASVGGGTVTLSPIAGGSCLLTIADSSTPTLSASVLVNVAAAPAAVTVSPNSVAFVSQYSNAQNVTISGGTAPYSASGCQGVATASVNGQTLTVTPAGVGTCTLSIVDSARNTAKLSVSVNASSTGSDLDNLTFHQNAARLGWYQNEVALNTTTVASSSFGLLGTLAAPAGMPAFGKVYAQPLFVTNETVSGGGVHNLIIIATETDQIYAFDETTHAVIWHRDFTGAGVTPQSFEDSGCSDVNPVVGITGTPVIDRAQNKLYVVVATKENGNGVLRLHAVSLASGADAVAPVPITGSVALATGGIAQIDPTFNFNRGALLEANGAIYVTLGTHCDDHASTTHGWILSYNPSTLQQVNSIVDTTNAEPDASGHFLGSPWMGGYGPSADAQGNIYIATGNGAFDGVNNFGNSVLKLPGNLNMSGADFFAPTTATTDGLSDLDLGSGGTMVLPNLPGAIPHLLVQGGKCDSNNKCYKRLINRDALGGQQPGDAGVVAELNVGGGIWGGPAYFADASGVSHIVYGGGTPLSTLNVNTSPVSLSVQSSANVGCLECRDHGSQPVVSSNGTEPGTAVVWALKTPGQMGGQITLYAFDGLNMSHTLFAGTAGNWTMTETALWVGGALVSPLVVDGRVYVPTDGTVAVFGLR